MLEDAAVAVVGSRHLKLSGTEFETLLKRVSDLNATEVVSGGAKGADSYAPLVAGKLSVPFKVFEANWGLHGRKAAGPIRNTEIVNYSDVCIALVVGSFKDSRGTKDTVTKSLKKGLKVIVYYQELGLWREETSVRELL